MRIVSTKQKKAKVDKMTPRDKKINSLARGEIIMEEKQGKCVNNARRES